MTTSFISLNGSHHPLEELPAACGERGAVAGVVAGGRMGRAQAEGYPRSGPTDQPRRLKLVHTSAGTLRWQDVAGSL